MVFPLFAALGGFLGSAGGAAAITAGASLIGGAMARSDARRGRANEIEDMLLKGERIRESAIRGGFNPLSFLGATGGAIGTPSNGVPPLASTQMLVDGFVGMSDALTGRAAQREQRAKLEMDLLSLQAEKLRAESAAGAIQPRPGAAILGAPTGTAPSTRTTAQPEKKTVFAPYDADREMERLPASDGPGLTTIDNDLLPGPVHVLGTDGEPWGADEILFAIPQAIPQITYHWGAKIGTWFDRRALDRAYRRWSENVKTGTPERRPTQPPAGRNPRLNPF